MEKELFSPMAIDALGEMMNISLGSSATAVSNMLDHRVDITTPKVSVVETKDFEIGNLDPALGVEIKYVEGLEGSNIMLLKRSDVKVIVDILLGTEMPEEEFELNELTISAVCELMNQMMGAASTALSDFLGYTVNISTPETFELKDMERFKEEHMPHEDKLVVVRFKLIIENALESEFLNVMTADLARKLLAGLGLEDEDVGGAAESGIPANSPTPQAKSEEPPVQAAPAQPAPAPAAEPEGASDPGKKMSQEDIERMLAAMNGGGDAEDTSQPEPAPTPPPAPAPAPTPAPQPAAPPVSQPQMAPMPANQPAAAQMPTSQPQAAPMPQGIPNGYMGYPPMYYQPPMAAAPQPKVINTQPMPMQQFDATESLSEEQAQNLDLIMEVPLQVTVEIGRTRRKVQDILSFSKGALVVLDKLAGDQVDLLVNGKCIARGDVVVVEDNFGVRITEIMQNTTLKDLVQK